MTGTTIREFIDGSFGEFQRLVFVLAARYDFESANYPRTTRTWSAIAISGSSSSGCQTFSHSKQVEAFVSSRHGQQSINSHSRILHCHERLARIAVHPAFVPQFTLCVEGKKGQRRR